MHIIATFVHPDEPCYGLWEGPAKVPAFPRGEEWHWVQRVFVLRDDAIAKFETDFGPDGQYERVTEILLPSPDGVNTVGQLQAIAERNRHDDYWAKRRDEMLASSTLIKDHIDQLEMQQEFRKRFPRTVKELIRAR